MSPLTHVATSALDSLRAHPPRTSLSMLGIVMGAASLAAVLALGDGAQRLAREQVEREGMNLVLAQPITEDVIDGLRCRGNRSRLHSGRADRVSAAIGPWLRCCCRWKAPVSCSNQDSARAARIRAVRSTSGPPMLRCSPTAALSADEMKNGAPVAIVGSTLRDARAAICGGVVRR
jgi:hypothetical protein